MGKQSGKLGVGSKVSVRAVVLGVESAEFLYPGGLHRPEIISDLEILQIDPPNAPGKAHIVHVEHHGRRWKVEGSRVKVTTPAAKALQIGNYTHSTPAQQPASSNPATNDDPESDSESDIEDGVDRFIYSFEPDFSTIDVDLRQEPRRNPKILEGDPAYMDPVSFFFHFLPTKFFSETIVPAINEEAARMEVQSWTDITFDELMAWIGVWFAMTFVDLPRTRDYWNKTDTGFLRPSIDMGSHCGISISRFESIRSVLALCPRPASTEDHFWSVRPLLTAWNAHMKDHYRCGWSTCLDESMMQWDNPDDPGWVFVARKFTQKGNEFHTIADTITKIVFNMELVEGKDRPEARGPPEFSTTHGKTGGLLLRMTKDAALVLLLISTRASVS